MSSILERKSSHLSLCARGDVEHRQSTLLDEVHLLHNSLPELSYADIDLEVRLFGRSLSAPLIISGMSGATSEARQLNRALAAAAQKLGLGMGVGSQRAMLIHPETAGTYQVRDVAPDILLLANLGVVQVRDLSISEVANLVDVIGADALCVHLNPAQELVQDGGDRDFRGCESAIARLAECLPVPVIVKETGCGMSPQTLGRLRAAGVEFVDVSGAGGTSWTGVEALRGSSRQQARGLELREWGIPTAAAVVYARRARLRTIASGGIRTALDVVNALALGAEAVSMALPFLRSYMTAGAEGVLSKAEELAEGLRRVCLLVGAARVLDVHQVPRVLGPRLHTWIEHCAPELGARDFHAAG